MLKTQRNLKPNKFLIGMYQLLFTNKWASSFPKAKNYQGQVQTVDSVHMLLSAEANSRQSESKGDLKNFQCKET